MRIRPAGRLEGERLRQIMIAAKSHWGYDRARVASWAANGDFSPESLRARGALVVEEDGRVVAWVASFSKDDVWWVDDLWVDPDWMGQGIGTALFQHVAEQAGREGFAQMEWEAEPNALGFYAKMGARHLRDGELSSWGRVNAVMGIDLSPRISQ